MPKIVDHEARRRQIADAVHRVIDARGLDSVSLREVAAEAGMSMGAVQHYFAGKDEMLTLAMLHLNTRITLRVAGAAHDGTPLGLLRVALLELLPLDEERRFEARVGLAFLARSVVAEPLAALLREGMPLVLAFYSDQIRAAQAAGQMVADLDPGLEATVLFAFAQGMVNPLLIGHYRAEDAVAAIDYQLRRLSTGR
ncbi:TetR family transcriptional regulator C-terminal domain-containing protein [Nonomuraea sp. NBC_01738]|uniref:TetR/AcrR family transcriptional regulator n=1 Tax=Nonomuraea sp. NBC_01738 TaxID=2976003 RepID=UPI002E0D8741|nr:TetR family transcriptional regulator C-terminal domain-containing protein [Nonomuraea sp. NBC_01738]